MSIVYVFEATIVKYAKDRYVIYPPTKRLSREAQEVLRGEG